MKQVRHECHSNLNEKLVHQLRKRYEFLEELWIIDDRTRFQEEPSIQEDWIEVMMGSQPEMSNPIRRGVGGMKNDWKVYLSHGPSAQLDLYKGKKREMGSQKEKD